MTKRRNFLAQLGVAAAAIAFNADEARASSAPPESGPWDTSWLDRLATAQYRVVFNASEMNDGEVLDYANTFFVHFHEAHGTTDAQTRPVIVFRRLGTSLALNDVGRRLAAQTKRGVDEVQKELRANLVPGAILVPSGIYALIRAQNAGCAFMPGT